jgi:AcrR family transcriptional regulator
MHMDSATITTDTARSAVLRASDELFYARGIGGVTMSEIRDTSGVALRRLYVMYPSKRDLVAAWLTDRHGTWMAWFTASVDRRVTAGADWASAVFDALAEWIANPTFRGCAFLNSLAETSELDDAHRTIIAAHKREVVMHLARLAERDRHDSPAWLPSALGVLIDGAIVQCTVFASTEPLDAARSAARKLLEASPA